MPCGASACAVMPKPDGFDPSNEHTWDSDDYPKGPYADGGGEADSPQFCAHCNAFLRNPLTADGLEYVRHNPASRDVLDFYRDAL